jgi:CheY-like chemotaxis protein
MATEATLLVVDDEFHNRDLVARTFQRVGRYRVLTAGSGPEALQVLAKEKVDVLLVDYAMPEMTGLQLLETAGHPAPAIMITAYPELDQVRGALKNGLIKHIIAKPWRPNDLASVVEKVLALTAMRRAVDSMKGDK